MYQKEETHMIEKRNLFFIVDTPVNSAMMNYYRVKMFQNAGYSIRFADISPITNKSADIVVKREKIQGIEVRVYNNKRDVVRQILTLQKDTIIFISFGNSRCNCFVLRAIKKSGLRYGSMSLNLIYEGTAEKKQNKNTRPITFSRVINHIYNKIPLKYMGIRPRDFFITNSRREISTLFVNLCDKNTKFIVVNSNAYDECVINKKEKRIVEGRYCVWLDTYLPYHPDMERYIKGKIDADNYYLPLREFFKWIEGTYQIKVVIAAHPKSDYNAHQDSYYGFQIIKNYTRLLVRDSEFVLVAHSTSFMYALVYMKTMIFVSQNLINDNLPMHKEHIHMLSEGSGQGEIVIEDFLKDKNNKVIFDELLRRRKDKYIEMGKDYIKEDFDGNVYDTTSDFRIIDYLSTL